MRYNHFMKHAIGYLEVIAGPMFSGKTEELIRQVKRAAIGKKHVQVFKHNVDTRYGKGKKVYSHAGVSFDSELVGSVRELSRKIYPKSEIIAIDEAQWFGPDLVPLVTKLLKQGKKVLVAGLALTFDREPFIPMPTLMAMADKVTKLSAICGLCGEEAIFHKRITKTKINPYKADPTLVGRTESYQARCRNCFEKL